MAHCQVTGMKPTVLKSLMSGRRILKIPFHHNISLNHNFTQSCTVSGYRLHSVRVHHADTFFNSSLRLLRDLPEQFLSRPVQRYEDRNNFGFSYLYTSMMYQRKK